MSDTSLLNYMISYAMTTHKSVKIEDAPFETEECDTWYSGESVVFMIRLQNHRSSGNLHQFHFKELMKANP